MVVGRLLSYWEGNFYRGEYGLIEPYEGKLMVNKMSHVLRGEKETVKPISVRPFLGRGFNIHLAGGHLV